MDEDRESRGLGLHIYTSCDRQVNELNNQHIFHRPVALIYVIHLT